MLAEVVRTGGFPQSPSGVPIVVFTRIQVCTGTALQRQRRNQRGTHPNEQVNRDRHGGIELAHQGPCNDQSESAANHRTECVTDRRAVEANAGREHLRIQCWQRTVGEAHEGTEDHQRNSDPGQVPGFDEQEQREEPGQQLGFLGLGAQPPTPEWGLLLAEGIGYVERAPWTAVAPALCLVLVSVCAVAAAGMSSSQRPPKNSGYTGAGTTAASSNAPADTSAAPADGTVPSS